MTTYQPMTPPHPVLFSCVYVCDFGSCQVGVWFNRKANHVEVVLDQAVPAARGQIFTGKITVRVHEVDGVYDKSFTVSEKRHVWIIPCHTKPRRRKKMGGE
jgi:hypothetical protein